MCMICRSLFVLFVLLLLDIVMSVLLQFTESYYPFGIFKIFLSNYNPVYICLQVFLPVTCMVLKRLEKLMLHFLLTLLQITPHLQLVIRLENLHGYSVN